MSSKALLCLLVVWCILPDSTIGQGATVEVSGSSRSSGGGTTSTTSTSATGSGDVVVTSSRNIPSLGGGSFLPFQGGASVQAGPGASAEATSTGRIVTSGGESSITITADTGSEGGTGSSIIQTDDSSEGVTSFSIEGSGSTVQTVTSSETESVPSGGPTSITVVTESSGESVFVDEDAEPQQESVSEPVVIEAPEPAVAAPVLPPPVIAAAVAAPVQPAPVPQPKLVPEPAPISPSAKEDLLAKYGIDVNNMRDCRGAADWKCCDVQDFVNQEGGTFCGCTTTFRGSDSGFCRWERIHSDPAIWKETRDSVPEAFKFCRCTNSGYKPCEGLTKRECCDSYMGLNECQCKGSLCNYKRVQENPLVWEDQFIAEGRRCKCAF